MAHGYLRDYDDDDRDEDRGRWREESRESGWRDRNSREHDRNFMFGPEGDRSRGEQERFREDDRQYRNTHEDRRSGSEPQQGYGRRQGGFGGSSQEHRGFRGGSGTERTPRNFSSHQDDHYRSWRERQMQALDRDYEDYCREREQQFHSDFDAWRSQRRGSQEPLRTGMTQTSQTGDPTGMLELTNEKEAPGAGQPDPMGSATLGTNSSGQSGTR